MEQRETTPNVINILAGLWLIITPYIFGYSIFAAPTTNHVIVGIIVALVAIVKFFYHAMWFTWINILAGIWLIISPFVLNYFGIESATWNSVILGAIVIVFSGWSARILSTRAHRIRTA
jgi:hypothetical protein